MKTQTEILDSLGLLYEKTQLPTIESSVEPNGGILNLDKVLVDNPECWDTIAIGSSQLEKKTIILKGGLDKTAENFYLKQQVIKKLIGANFSVYVPTKEGLRKIEVAEQYISPSGPYSELEPAQEAAELKKLNLIPDRVVFLDSSAFADLCTKILSSPDAFFNFINCITLEPQELFSELGYSEIINRGLSSAVEWSFDPHPNMDRDWQEKYINLNIGLSKAEEEKKLTPQFLQTTPLSAQTTPEYDKLYFSYLVQHRPDILKKLTHISLANSRVPLFPFLNKREGLLSLALRNCEVESFDEHEDENNEEPLLTTSLRHLETEGDVVFSVHRFATLLNNSPNLMSLNLTGGEIWGEAQLKLQPKKTANLKTISLHQIRTSINHIAALINATPNLRELTLHSLLRERNHFLEINSPLVHLKKLCINASLTFDELYKLVNAAPNLETLEIYRFDFTKSHDFLFQLEHKLKALKKIIIMNAIMTLEQLHSLLKSAPNLTELSLSYCFINQDAMNCAPNSLPNLKTLYAVGMKLTSQQLLNLIVAASHLHNITIDTPDNFSDFLNSLQPGSLPSLNHISFNTGTLPFAELNQLIKIAPNLKSISFPAPKERSELLATQWFKHSYPQIEIKLLDNYSKESVRYTDGSLSLDGKIGHSDTIPTLPARTIFKAKDGSNPAVSSYHLNTFSWPSLSRNFSRYSPIYDDLEPVSESLKRATQQIEEQFNHPETSQKLVYGQITFEKPQVGEWLQLPALSTHDKLINYAAEHPDFEIKRCTYSGYYFIKFKKRVESCLVNYILEPGSNFDFTLKKKAPQEHLEWISKLSFAPSEELVNCEEYQKLLNLDEEQRIQALAEYCRFEKESASSDIKGNSVDILNALIKQRAGVCRHRAQLFIALANALQINAKLIDNDVHQFIVVQHKDTHFTVDLGGGIAHIVGLPMPLLKKEQDKKTSEVSAASTKKTIPPLKPGNRFQTWNNFPIQAANAEELVKKLTSKNSPTRQWLIFKDNQGIEALHQASSACNNTFFSCDVDSLILRNLHIAQNKDHYVDSPISQFLKNAALNPNESFNWFINWSDPKARHVSLNSVIDTEDRNLGGLPIPPNVHIVVGMDERSAFKMGDDFYSRFDAISQAPDIPPLGLPEIKSNQPIGDDDVLFPSALNWESIFLGRYTFDEGALDILPGALLKASQNKTSRLILHNAPFDDPKFRFLLTELMAKKRFFFNGEWHDLPKDFRLEFAQPDLSTYPEVITPKVTPGKKRIVNQTTLPLFSNQYKITKDGTLKPLLGFFAADPAIELLVTDNLTEIQWYSLLKEAKKAQCALTIKTTPKVFVPEPLKQLVIPIETLGESNRLIISNDLDDAEEHYKPVDAITINVDPKTNFNSLFFHVSLKNRLFQGEETELLKAIKKGNPVIFKGQFSTTFAQQLQTLFIDPPTLLVNGEPVLAKNITLISDNAAPFKAVHKTLHVYRPEEDFARLSSDLAEQLKKTYQKLKLIPCHSHFIDLPHDPTLHAQWLDNLTQRLEWRAGILPDIAEPTTPEMVMDYLDKHSFVFLTSKTGAGKSYFVQKILPKYGKEHHKQITLYHELAGVKNWLGHKGESQPVLFLDEANISLEHYALFEALARGEKEFWYEGTCYPLKNHKIIFAGNPTHYEGRFEPDLFKRFPNYFPFEGQRLDKILSPLLVHCDDATSLLKLIETYYVKAQDAGLNITPRNAQTMCLRFFILKESSQTKLMTDDFLMRYAILSEIKTISLDKKLSQHIRYDIKKGTTWKEEQKELKEVLQQFQPKTTDKKFIWTDSRKKIALSIEMLMRIREKKIKGEWDQEIGINGIILEAEPGLGKSQLVQALLKAKGIEFMTISPINPKEVQAKLLDAFHKGQVVCIEEFNTQVHEHLLNALLSGYDLEGNPPQKPGFCIIGTQNPTTFHGRQPLSKALENRLMFVELSHYNFDELIKILTEKFQLLVESAKTVTEEYFSARTYAQSQSLFPPPNPRNVMKIAEEEQNRQEVLVY
ncbi:transglutaminase domain-containing protein [Legionella bozemanae]|uniref:transglutaminase domain-containing protein n=1 Tax=Legionella bozemanae TaxID=447 RepID=UPI001041828E|nr:transglutaminase domain-containing protein [Legionella bozemanae]